MPNNLNNYKTGLVAEEVAIKYLEKQNFSIITHRFKYKTGEIDIIAVYKNLLIFCEVKASIDTINIYYKINIKQQKRIINTAKYWLAQNTDYLSFDIRFDCILISDHIVLEHIINAWQEY